MTYRVVCNQTALDSKRSVVSETLEAQRNYSPVSAAENSPNTMGFDTVADDGTPIVYKAHEHRACGEAQYDANPIP